MSLKRGLYSWLTAQAGITAIAGDRIWPEVIPQQDFDQASKRPCLVFSREAAERERTFCGTQALLVSRMRIDAYARTYDGAEQLAQAVRSALTDYAGLMGSTTVQDAVLEQDFDLMDLEPGLFRVSLVFAIWHTETL